jgi:hypothetical protein
LNVVGQFTNKSFDEDALVNLRDAELLRLCVELNLITEDGFFFLDQARDVRNNFSSAHPAMGQINDIEFVAFVDRCTRYALAATEDPRGVDSQAFLTALKAGRFTAQQTASWLVSLRRTHALQRELLFGMLHGIYCDPASGQPTRLNAIDLCKEITPELSDTAKSRAIEQHWDYAMSGQEDRRAASQDFFQQLGAVAMLGEAEQHAIFARALQTMLTVHQGWDNFHNEPAFAERLLQLTKQMAVPDSVQEQFVDTVLTCAAGNPYGISRAARPAYETMIKDFSPREVRLMLHVNDRQTILRQRLTAGGRVRARFVELVRLIEPGSVSPADQGLYDWWLRQ